MDQKSKMGKNSSGTVVIDNDHENILEFLVNKSGSIYKYIENNTDSEYTLIKKRITHSDIPTFAKKTDKNMSLSKNILYYLSEAEMEEIQERENKKFEVAKQSNIAVPDVLFTKLNITKLQNDKDKDCKNHKHITINDHADVLLVNDTLDYFKCDYTRKVLKKLKKDVNWKEADYEYIMSNDEFTNIQLTHAIHGLGTSADTNFHKLRRNIFLNDTIIFIIEVTPNGQKKLFIVLEKNPLFFSIINETNKKYENYLIKSRQKDEKFLKITIDEDDKTRKQQNSWRSKLAEEMMNFTTTPGNVFCPFTYIEGNFEDVGTMYRASHIKSFSNSTIEEAYDINNGLLLVANADSLFDKHLITVNENKELEFSFLLNDEKQKSQLMLNSPIFKLVLNDKRMEYMKEHRKIFKTKEEQRKK